MDLSTAAFKLGVQLIEDRLHKLAATPDFARLIAPSASPEPYGHQDLGKTNLPGASELPTTDSQKRDRSAKIHPPRVISLR